MTPAACSTPCSLRRESGNTCAVWPLIELPHCSGSVRAIAIAICGRRCPSTPIALGKASSTLYPGTGLRATTHHACQRAWGSPHTTRHQRYQKGRRQTMFETPTAALPDIIGPYRPALAGLDQDLVRVDLDIRAWRAHATLNAVDLGLDASQEYDQTLQDYLWLGRKRLLPTRYAQERDRIEREAREALRRSSYETELGFLVPKVRWPALREKLVSDKTQYEQLVAAITSEAVYATICEELQRVYTKAAHQAWNIRQGLGRRRPQPSRRGSQRPKRNLWPVLWRASSRPFPRLRLCVGALASPGRYATSNSPRGLPKTSGKQNSHGCSSRPNGNGSRRNWNSNAWRTGLPANRSGWNWRRSNAAWRRKTPWRGKWPRKPRRTSRPK